MESVTSVDNRSNTEAHGVTKGRRQMEKLKSQTDPATFSPEPGMLTLIAVFVAVMVAAGVRSFSESHDGGRCVEKNQEYHQKKTFAKNIKRRPKIRKECHNK